MFESRLQLLFVLNTLHD